MTHVHLSCLDSHTSNKKYDGFFLFSKFFFFLRNNSRFCYSGRFGGLGGNERPGSDRVI